MFQLETGNFGQDTNHRGNAVLSVVILQEVDDLLMFSGDLFDAFAVFYKVNPFRAPLLKRKQEAVFINFKIFTFKFNRCNTLKPPS